MNTEEKDSLLKRLDEAHAEEKTFNRETYGERDFDPDEETLYSDAAAAIRALAEKGPDNVSDLKVGDTVKTLISYVNFEEGMVGRVKALASDEYPIKVKFDKHQYDIGYKRHELGKVSE